MKIIPWVLFFCGHVLSQDLHVGYEFFVISIYFNVLTDDLLIHRRGGPPSPLGQCHQLNTTTPIIRLAFHF